MKTRAINTKNSNLNLKCFVVLIMLTIVVVISYKLNRDSKYYGYAISRNRLYKGNLSIAKPTLIFTCLGTHAFTKYQTYIWQALQQAQLTNPSIPLVVILNKDAYVNSTFRKLHYSKIKTVLVEDLLESNTLLQEFRRLYFESGGMTPDGNRNFVQYVLERLLVLYAYINQTGLTNIFHLENDNMLYGNLYQLAVQMHVCNVSLGIARAARSQAIASFVFIRNGKAIEHFVRWFLNVFKMGPKKAIEFMGTPSINDMTLGARYLRLFAASPQQSLKTGVFELPTSFYFDIEPCCLCHIHSNNPVIFDACVLGQYFGGTHARPDSPHWERNRLVDPRGLLIEWRNSDEDNLRRPYIKNIQIINLHVHSKKLYKFSSLGYNQTKQF